MILSDADITCTVAPAILFLNAYECDVFRSHTDSAMEIDTTKAGINLILEGKNSINGSHVAKIWKNQKDEQGNRKKLWKQDGAIHSYVSMNVYGPGKLNLTGDKEGLSSDLHITIFDGDISIKAMDDGINVSKASESVITVNGGFLRIISGLLNPEGDGDGIDSNGYIVVNGGTLIIQAPLHDAPFDGESVNGSPIFIHGGTVVTMGAREDMASSASKQSSIYWIGNFKDACESTITVTNKQGKVVFAYDPSKDDFINTNLRPHTALMLSCKNFELGETYHLWLGSTLSGNETDGVYQDAVMLEPGTQIENLANASEDTLYDFDMSKKITAFQTSPYPAE